MGPMYSQFFYQRSFTVSLLVFLFWGCATASSPQPAAVVQPAAVLPASAEIELQSAEKSYHKKEVRNASKKAHELIGLYPHTNVASRAHYILGKIAQDSGNDSEALKNYLAAANDESTISADADLNAARMAVKLGRPEEARLALEHVAKRNDLSAQQKNTYFVLSFNVYVALKRNGEALESAVLWSQTALNPADQKQALSSARDLIDSHMAEGELEKASGNKALGPAQLWSKYRLGVLALDQKRFSQARGIFKDVTQLAPESPESERAASYILQIDARDKVDSKVIGLVVPLTGKRATVGYKILRGVQLGLGIYGANSSGLRLSVLDSEANPDIARKAVARLVTEDGVIAIIGGADSKTVAAEATKAQDLGVPFIALSPKPGITQIGDSVFRNWVTGHELVQHIVETAMAQLHITKFAIMYPNDPYGAEYANLFWDAVRVRGGEITAVQPYNPKETDFGPAVQKLVGTYYTDDRAEEYRLRLKAWNEKNKGLNKTARSEQASPQKLLPPVIDFQAIFIPDTASKLTTLAAYLPYYDVDHVTLLGTNLWNSPQQILGRPELKKVIESAVFVDNFLSTDPVFLASDFTSSYRTVFSEDPGVFEIAAYDSSALIKQIVLSGETSRIGVAQRLASMHNFSGAIGTVTLGHEREMLHSLMTLRVKDGKILPLGLDPSIKN